MRGKWWPVRPANDNDRALNACCSCRCNPRAIGLDMWWRNGQLDMAGFQPHLVIRSKAFDPAATVYVQLQAMGDRGF